MTQKPGLASRTSATGRDVRAGDARDEQRDAPASAAQAGGTSTAEVTTNSATVTRQDGQRVPRRGAAVDRARPGSRARSRRKNGRAGASHSSAQATSQGSAISAVNRPNERPAATNASRFVRFETGSSSDPLFASRAHA